MSTLPLTLLLLRPHPPAALRLRGNYNMIMTGMKVLELIAGHNTSFSSLIRELIGNRLAFRFSPPLSRHAAGNKTDPSGGIFRLSCVCPSQPEP